MGFGGEPWLAVGHEVVLEAGRHEVGRGVGQHRHAVEVPRQAPAAASAM